MPWARSMVARSASDGGVGGDEACVAEGGEVFGGVEAEGGGVAERAYGAIVPRGAEGLGGVFDELEIVGFGEGGEGVHVRALAVEMDRHDGGCGVGLQEFGGGVR